MTAPTVEVSCTRCGRTRRVGQRTTTAKMIGATSHSGLRWLWCRTCRLLESIEHHRAAIRKLEEKVMGRRMRGL